MRFRIMTLGGHRDDAEFRKTRVVRSNHDEAVLRCGFCDGKGRGTAFGSCTVCWSRGEVTVSEPFRRCRPCRGTGRATASTTLVCMVCRGKGAVSVPESSEACPVCGGKGKVGGPGYLCSRCRGAGIVPRTL
jgi:RecJ-like exonuclease